MVISYCLAYRKKLLVQDGMMLYCVFWEKKKKGKKIPKKKKAVSLNDYENSERVTSVIIMI